MKMQKKVIYVEGMHCNACKILIKKAIIDIKNISNVKVNVRKGTVEIFYSENQPDIKEVEKAIKEIGYQVCDYKIKKAWFTKDKSDYLIFFVSLIGFLILYLLIKKLGRISSDFSTEKGELSFGFAALIGLIAGFSSCMAIIGGLVLAVSSKWNNENGDTKFIIKFISHIWFNLGRIVGFGIFGGILGLLGGILKLSPTFLSFMTLVVGIILILLGLNLTKISPKFDTLLTLPTGNLFQKGSEELRNKNRIIYAIFGGLLTFFLPCGFTFSMQLYALSSGSFWTGAIIMIAFAMGTLPGLLGIGALTSIFKGKIAKIFYQIVGVLVILLGIYNISNVWGNIQGLLSKNTIIEEQQIETINIKYTSKGLEPSTITVYVGKTYHIIIDSQTTIYGCMSTITLPGLDNTIKEIKKGNQIIFELTPTEPGTYGFTCAMGVSHNAKIIVK